jgi:hypothetical protein
MPSLQWDGDMHRPTINLDEAVFLRVKGLARRMGKSLARTIEDLLRAALSPGILARVCPPVHRGNGPLPGVDIAGRERLYDLMERR